jgi:Ni/Co efflux regulator RcnB
LGEPSDFLAIIHGSRRSTVLLLANFGSEAAAAAVAAAAVTVGRLAGNRASDADISRPWTTPATTTSVATDYQRPPFTSSIEIRAVAGEQGW